MNSERLVLIWIKGLAWFTVVVLFLAFAFLTMLITQAEIDGWAISDYYAQNPSTWDECKQIRPGMDLHQVLGVINRKAEPSEEILKPDRFTFWRTSVSCVVELDPNTQKVVKVHTEDAPGWPPPIE